MLSLLRKCESPWLIGGCPHISGARAHTHTHTHSHTVKKGTAFDCAGVAHVDLHCPEPLVSMLA